MWYGEDKPSLDMGQAIVAQSSTHTYLLIGHWIDGKKVYDWFNIQSGEWNSSHHWCSAQDAIDEYKRNYTIKNAVIEVS